MQYVLKRNLEQIVILASQELWSESNHLILMNYFMKHMEKHSLTGE